MVELEIGGSACSGASSSGTEEILDNAENNEINKNALTTDRPPLLVREVGLRRAREVLRTMTGSAGSLCLVVRRPG